MQRNATSITWAPARTTRLTQRPPVVACCMELRPPFSPNCMSRPRPWRPAPFRSSTTINLNENCVPIQKLKTRHCHDAVAQRRREEGNSVPTSRIAKIDKALSKDDERPGEEGEVKIAQHLCFEICNFAQKRSRSRAKSEACGRRVWRWRLQ